MDEHKFLIALRERAKEQEKIMQDMPFPKVFSIVSMWLGNHPWRLLIPFAFLISIILHFSVGKHYDNLVLKIFGGFGFLRFH